MPESFFRTVNEWIAAWAVFILVILHYVIFGPKRVEHAGHNLAVVRFSTGERIIHYSLLFLFGIQAFTGLITFSALPFSSGTVGEINTIHRYSGYLFMLDVLLVYFFDGCYFGNDRSYHNLGQRDGNLRLIAHPIHNIAAFIGIIAVMIHTYLGSLANPGTLSGIFEESKKTPPVKRSYPYECYRKGCKGEN